MQTTKKGIFTEYLDRLHAERISYRVFYYTFHTNWSEEDDPLYPKISGSKDFDSITEAVKSMNDFLDAQKRLMRKSRAKVPGEISASCELHELKDTKLDVCGAWTDPPKRRRTNVKP